MNMDKRERSVSDRVISSLERTRVISPADLAAVVSVVMSTSFGAHEHTSAVKSPLD
jgi:hypothetical protein